MSSVDLKKMRIVSILWGIILVGLLLLLTVFGLIYKNQSKKYKDYERVLESSAQEYIEKNGIDVEEELRITTDDLRRDNLLEVNELTDDCHAYVIISKKSAQLIYQGFIKCEKYMTKGYQK